MIEGLIMNSIATKTLRDLAVEIPGATRVFENLGIESLDDACGLFGPGPFEGQSLLAYSQPPEKPARRSPSMM